MLEKWVEKFMSKKCRKLKKMRLSRCIIYLKRLKSDDSHYNTCTDCEIIHINILNKLSACSIQVIAKELSVFV